MTMYKPIILGLALIAGLVAFGSTAAAQPKPLVVVNRAELKDGVLYDAWVEFRDKGESEPAGTAEELGGPQKGDASASASQAQGQSERGCAV